MSAFARRASALPRPHDGQAIRDRRCGRRREARLEKVPAVLVCPPTEPLAGAGAAGETHAQVLAGEVAHGDRLGSPESQHHRARSPRNERGIEPLAALQVVAGDVEQMAMLYISDERISRRII